MKIILNGADKEVRGPMTISSLLDEVGISPDRVAVEVNQQIIDRHEFRNTFFKEGDRIEVIGFVGGGIA